MEILEVLKMNKRQKFIYSLINFKEKEFYIADLEKFFGYKNPQQDLRKLIRELINLNIFVSIKRDRRGIEIYKLNKSKLDRLIRQGDVFVSNGEFIESTSIIYRY